MNKINKTSFQYAEGGYSVMCQDLIMYMSMGPINDCKTTFIKNKNYWVWNEKSQNGSVAYFQKKLENGKWLTIESKELKITIADVLHWQEVGESAINKLFKSAGMTHDKSKIKNYGD